VVPGMEGCHWPFRKTGPEGGQRLLQLLLGGSPVKAKEAVGWLIDHAGPTEEAIEVVWKIVTGGDSGVALRELTPDALDGIPTEVTGLPEADGPGTEAARKAILDCVRHACGSSLSEALAVQTKHSAGFMTTSHCRKGRIGAERARTVVG